MLGKKRSWWGGILRAAWFRETATRGSTHLWDKRRVSVGISMPAQPTVAGFRQFLAYALKCPDRVSHRICRGGTGKYLQKITRIKSSVRFEDICYSWREETRKRLVLKEKHLLKNHHYLILESEFSSCSSLTDAFSDIRKVTGRYNGHEKETKAKIRSR